MRLKPPRVRLSYANVMATLAVFIALGGTSYAVTKIRGKDIAARTITGAKLKRGTISRAEIARGAITESKLSRVLAERLPEFDEPSFSEDSGSFPGEPGPPGEPGEPGPPGAAGCDPSTVLLCGDGDLPGGQTVALVGGGVERGHAYRTQCATTPTPSCTVTVAAPEPAPAAVDAWYQQAVAGASAATRDLELVVRDASKQVSRLVVENGVPTALVHQGDRYQLTLRAASVRP